MKKIIAIFLAFCFILSSCRSGGKPDDVSQEMYDSAVYVLKVCDRYLSGDATQEETKEKLESIKTPDMDITSASSREVDIWSGIMGLHNDCTYISVEEFDISDFKEHRDKIAEAINYK